jgi:SH3 domain protein
MRHAASVNDRKVYDMKRLSVALGIIVAIGLSGPLSWADTAYVTDSLRITLRTGPSVDNKVIGMLESGEVVEVLNTQDDWSFIRLSQQDEEEKEGWVLSRYLMRREPWVVQAETLREENTRLRERTAILESRLGEAVRKEQALSKEGEQKAKDLQEIKEEYQALKEGAKGYLRLQAIHKATQSELETARNEVRRLTDENERLRSSQMNRWFATGALVLLCGLLIGFMVGRQQRRRRSLYT